MVDNAPMQGPAIRVCVFAVVALLVACGGGRRRSGGLDAGASRDAGPGVDAGMPVDGGGRDAGPARDSGVDAGTTRDAGGSDAGGSDAGPPDAGPPDAGPPDSGPAGDTIPAIQRGTIAAGAHVVLRNVVVTGVYGAGVWVQDPTAGAAYAGIRVYQGVAPSVARNALVDVEGDVLEYFGDTEIDAATVTPRGTATPIAPARRTVAQAAMESYEGVLVELTDISTVDSFWDCSLDDVACFDSGLWQVNGTGGILVYDFVYEDADWASRVGDTPVAGIMTWRYNRRRIMPRVGADFLP